MYHPEHTEVPVQTYKLQPFSINREVEMSDVTAVSVTTDYRGRRPLRPLNLAEDGDLIDAEYGPGQNLDLTWTNTMEDRPLPMWSYWSAGLTDNLPKTVLEFLTVADVLKRTVTLDPGVAAYTYLNSELVADFGAEETIVVRAYHERDSFRSLLFQELTVEYVP